MMSQTDLHAVQPTGQQFHFVVWFFDSSSEDRLLLRRREVLPERPLTFVREESTFDSPPGDKCRQRTVK